MAFQLPAFENVPTATMTDETEPGANEINNSQGVINTWKTSVLAQLTVLNPNHAFALAFPGTTTAQAQTATRVARVADLRAYATALFPVYAGAYATAAQALAGGQAGPQAHVPRPPKTKLPDTFTGKSAASARHFFRQCNNYAAIAPFVDPETQIRWILQLIDGEAAAWRDEQLDAMELQNPPLWVGDVDAFSQHFQSRWMDPHEAEKALDAIMEKKITQKTSVKRYNDEFNEALGLTAENGTNSMVVRSYETGLKAGVRNAAVAPRMVNPNMTLSELQSLMVRIDETLMQTRTPNTNPRSSQRIVFNQPVLNLPATPHTASTPAPRGQTPIKVEAARQFTKLTPEERAELTRLHGCFRCREVPAPGKPGHLAQNCPNRGQRINAIAAETTTPVTTTTSDSASISDVPASDF